MEISGERGRYPPKDVFPERRPGCVEILNSGKMRIPAKVGRMLGKPSKIRQNVVQFRKKLRSKRGVSFSLWVLGVEVFFFPRSVLLRIPSGAKECIV